MKKALLIFFTVIIGLCFCSCSGEVAVMKVRTVEQSAVFNDVAMAEELDAFIGSGEDARKDRTSFSEGEKKAAEYIKNRLTEYGYVAELDLITQSVETEVVKGYGGETQKLYSQNIIATYNGGKEKTVVVGANYDNLYKNIDLVGSSGNGSEGIMNNATGVATLLQLAKVFKENAPALDYTVIFAFFGASEAGVVGSSRFVSDYIKDASNVLLMVNLDSIAGETVNVYSDEVDTLEGKMFLQQGENYATEFKKMSRFIPLMPQVYAENLNYTHIGQLGDHVVFFEKDVPVVNLFGGDADGFNYYSDKIDNADSFKAENPNYGKTMADTASLVYDCLTAEGFSAAAAGFRTEKFDYSFFMGGYFAYIVLIAIIIVAAITLIFVVKHLEKKYPYKPVIKRLKIAVFGMEYEQNTDNDIYVDIRRVENNPFPENKDDIDPFE